MTTEQIDRPPHFTKPTTPTAALVFADGTIVRGHGIGGKGSALGEICFNTAMTGYQEILTDPSYAGQIIAFTFPHIGNVGTNAEDHETASPAARGFILKTPVTNPANYRAAAALGAWAERHNLIGITGVDTRALTIRLRTKGAINAVILHGELSDQNLARAAAQAKEWPGLVGLDLAKEVTTGQTYQWTDGKRWEWPGGFPAQSEHRFKVVAVDFGVKRNILRCLSNVGADVTVVKADTSAEEILGLNPDGIFLSNGPGDPAATGDYSVPVIRDLVASGKPIFGICLGHQMLALALGAKTEKMHQGHHGANHPVKDLTTNKVEIVSMNHGFAVARDSLPSGVRETHVSLFDGSNCGLAVDGKPIFSVQHHPEASPGPQDSHYLFDRFADLMETAKG